MIKIKIISVVILQKNDTKVNVTYQDSWEEFDQKFTFRNEFGCHLIWLSK